MCSKRILFCGAFDKSVAVFCSTSVQLDELKKNIFNQKKNRDNCELFSIKIFFYRVRSQNRTLVVRSEMNRVRLIPIANSKISEELHRR